MKLRTLCEDAYEADLKDRVTREIMKGDSRLKKIISKHNLPIDAVIEAIKQQKCLFDLGSTYLEQIVSGIVANLVVPDQLNQARKLFGLDPLSRSKLRKEKLRSAGMQDLHQHGTFTPQ